LNFIVIYFYPLSVISCKQSTIYKQEGERLTELRNSVNPP